MSNSNARPARGGKRARRGITRGRGRGRIAASEGLRDAADSDIITDEFDQVVEQRHTKGDDAEEYVEEAVDNDFAGDEEEDEKTVRRMTKFRFEEDENLDEQFNEVGERIEPFNLRGERSEGFFDATGNFIWKKEVGGADPWLASLDNEEDLEARIGEAATAKRQKEEEENIMEEPVDNVDKKFLRHAILSMLQPGEMVLQAVKRLGPKQEPADLRKGRKATVHKSLDKRTPTERRDFDQLTELAAQLLREGEVDIYQRTREELQVLASYSDPNQEGVGPGQERPSRKRVAADMSGEGTWEYKGPDGNVHGPYTTAEIRQWRAQGFLTGPTAVQIRPVGEAALKPPGKRVAFTAEALASDFEIEDDEGGQMSVDQPQWQSSDSVDWVTI